MSTDKKGGIYSPVVTPFGADLAPDGQRLVRHCRWLLGQGVGLAVFGTNSEANSMSAQEKMGLMDDLVKAGIAPGRMMPGTGCCALTDTVELTRHALAHDIHDVLMLPPFYYKGVSDDGLFASYSEVIQRVGDASLRIYLYHIPPVSQVPLSIPLIQRLLDAYPRVIAGIKDSSGDWSNTQAMLQSVQSPDFNVYAGSESFLLDTLRGGGAGCITATGNVNPAAIVHLYETWQNEDADRQQAALNAVRQAFQQFSMIPALKAAVASYGDDPDWFRVRPPLLALGDAQAKKLITDLDKLGFSMPGLNQKAGHIG
ncbi:dihydrodipicolinate synthase family protein [Candidimonas nitroreducens]|uniref:Dihydrodipicolinate synthase family protein n=1 Tax=Candidimonas nitroreducens TaxID=683354 RepID=A0A225ML27_9BURK|nr:dihydrodipicolinate synthase family protein [Candidimonas nitroreducens]OWT61895.1 dihydrodipicolinate synthase family protein [Candidimonas nitroreducens]